MKITSQKGQALVELALSLMLLMTIVFGIFEFGRAMFISNTLNNIARESARRAAVTLPSGFEALKAPLIASSPLSAADKTAIAINIVRAPLDTITVTATLPFAPITPLIGEFFPPGFSLTGQATMRYEL